MGDVLDHIARQYGRHDSVALVCQETKLYSMGASIARAQPLNRDDVEGVFNRAVEASRETKLNYMSVSRDRAR